MHHPPRHTIQRDISDSGGGRDLATQRLGDANTMTRLVDLFAEKSTLPIREQARYIKGRLADVASDQQLKFRRLSDPILPASRRVLIGVATWSRYDFELIDAIAEKRQKSGASDEVVEIFDADEQFDDPAAPKQDFERYVPGIGKVFGSPVLGIWEGGDLVTRASGAAARQILIDRYELDLPSSET